MLHNRWYNISFWNNRLLHYIYTPPYYSKLTKPRNTVCSRRMACSRVGCRLSHWTNLHCILLELAEYETFGIWSNKMTNCTWITTKNKHKRVSELKIKRLKVIWVCAVDESRASCVVCFLVLKQNWHVILVDRNFIHFSVRLHMFKNW